MTPACVLDGVKTAALIKQDLRFRSSELQSRGITPKLGTLIVGKDPASLSYVNSKHRDCEEVGIASLRVELSEDATEAQIRQAVMDLNADPSVTGFITQLPLPSGVDEKVILEVIDPDKDADGLHPMNLGRLVLGVGGHLTSPVPCTPAGILELLLRNEVPVEGQHVVIVGRGITVGRPLGLLLTQRGVDATVTVAHSRTSNIPEVLSTADIVVAALGNPHFIRREWIKPGAAVLDVGVTRIGSTSAGRAKLAGDVDPAVREVAGWVSPNPGGVGPMTRAMLLANIVTAAERAASLALV